MFANVNLTASAVSAPAARPSFAMPSAHTQSAAKNPFSGIALSVPASKPPPPVNSQGSTRTEVEKLHEEFRKYIADLPPREDPSVAVKRFLTTALSLKQGEKKESEKSASTTLPSKEPTAHLALQTSTSTTPAPPSSSLSIPAPAPVAFSFGGSTSATQPTTSESKPIFSFGANKQSSVSGDGAGVSTMGKTSDGTKMPAFSFGFSAPNSTASTATSPPSASTSGFNFAPAPLAATPALGMNVKIALTPVADPSKEDGDEEEAPEEKTELASADSDWKELHLVSVKFYHFRNEGKHTKFAGGKLKLQQSNQDSKIRRMVMRDPAGKVLINIGIFQGMKFVKINQDKKIPGKTPIGQIFFFGTMDESRGPEKFLVVGLQDDIEGLHTTLEKLSS